MFCINCGKELPDDAKFCSGCGKQIETKEKEIINMVPVCSSCGEELKPDNKFCIKCGTAVNTSFITNTSLPAETFSNFTPESKIQKEEKNKNIGRVLFVSFLIFFTTLLWVGDDIFKAVGGIGYIILSIILIIQTIIKKRKK